jgi:hypothetical protein
MAGIPHCLHPRLRVALMDLDKFTDDETLRTVMRHTRRRPMSQRSA